MTEEKILDRVAKLLAVYEDHRAPEGERNAALHRAQALMMKHALDEAEVRMRQTGPRTKQVVKREIRIESPAYAAIKEGLISGIARSFRCRAISIDRFQGSKTRRVEIFGFEDDVDLVLTLCTSLMLQMASACAKEYPKGAGRAWKNGFYLSFCDEVVRRVADSNRRIEHEVTSDQSNALVLLRDIETDVGAALAAEYPRVRRITSQTRTDRRAHGAGQEAGRHADIGHSRLGGRAALGA
jgi:hypothetical protein